ncbi:hypothetical protein V8F20_006650 [Naviculisporaceae sp. PSN 640]
MSANLKRTYFLAPTRDYPPNGPIALGNLIKSPRTPEYPLNDPFSPTVQKLAASAHVSTETDATRSSSSSVTLRPSVWASFLSSLGTTMGQNGAPLGGGIDYTIHKAHSTEFVLPVLETRRIFPSLADIKAIFEEDGVQDALRHSRFRSNLYLITSVQVATQGGEYLIKKVRERGGNLHLVADWGNAAGVPGGANVGAGVEKTVKREDSAGGTVKGGFVFAYSLREVVYRKKRVVEQKPCTVQGDLMSLPYSDPRTPCREIPWLSAGDPDAVYENPDVYRRRRAVSPGRGGERTYRDVYKAELAGLKDEDPEMPKYWDLDVAEEGGVWDLDGEECQVVFVPGRGDDESDGEWEIV